MLLKDSFILFYLFFVKKTLNGHLNKDKQATWIPSLGMVGPLSNDRESQTEFLVNFFKTDEALNAMRIGFMVIWWLKFNGKIHHFTFPTHHLHSVTTMDQKYKWLGPVLNRK